MKGCVDSHGDLRLARMAALGRGPVVLERLGESEAMELPLQNGRI